MRCLYAAFSRMTEWQSSQLEWCLHGKGQGVDGKKAGVGWPPHFPSLLSFQPNWGQDGDKVKVKVKIRVKIQG